MTSLLPRAAVVLACALTAGLGAAACGSSSSSPPVHEVAVVAPDFVLQGCTYVLNGTVPAGEPDGVQPHFSSFAPDAAARSALESIKEHGGSAVVNGFIIPGGTHLYAGPDTSQPIVGTVPSNYAILAAEPVAWRDHQGDTWLAFFVSCGGKNLYWVSLNQMKHQNPQAAAQITPLVTKASEKPITVSDQNFGWKDSTLTFIIGRGELFGPVS
jgi:hypothetical protein